jgi:ABC-type glycerol-3-phosphate transport system substrate-binding protein
VSDSKAVDFESTTPVEWNSMVTKAFTFGGKTYAFYTNPGGSYGGSQHAQVLFFNKRLFREAGLDPDLPYIMQKDGTWTWDNFLEISRKLTRDLDNDGVVDTYSMTMDLSTEILDAIVASNGANYIDRDASGKFVNATNRPEFLEALQFGIRLKNEGVLMPRPSEDSNWDWYKANFTDGKVAMRIEPQYVVNELGNMKDDWGMVLFPKGPRAKDYAVFIDENVMVIPSTYKPAEVDRILTAVQAWNVPQSDDWKAGMYNNYRDSRAVDETVVMIRDPKYHIFKNHIFIAGLERGDIAWQMWWHEGDPAELVEAVSQSWGALVNDANSIVTGLK